MKKVIFLGVAPVAALMLGALLGLPVKAVAQPTPSPNWRGFDAGLDLGGVQNHDTGKSTCAHNGTVEAIGCSISAYGQLNSNGFLAGAQFGYNWQEDRLVVGPEVDFDSTSLSGSVNFPGPIAYVGGGGSAGTFNASESVLWLATARVRFGYALSPATLLYVTGGYAEANVNTKSNFAFSSIRYPADVNSTRHGWTEGVGAEWKLTPNASLKLEALSFNLPNYVTSATALPVPFGYTAGKNFEFHGSLLRAGVNWKI